MKKLFKLFAFAAIFGALSVSCSKEAAAPDEEVAPGADGTEVTAPADDENLPEGMIRLTFAVSAENEADPELKTSWDGTNHSWADGDQVRILWGTGDSDYYDAEVKSGGVSAVVSETAETFYAVYPASAASDFVLNADGTIDVSIPKEQDGTFASANKMVAKTTKNAASFAFKNVTHIFKFHLTSACNYDDFVFTSNENAKLIVDAFGVTFDGSDNITLGASTTSFNTLITHSKYVYLNDLAANSDYYFAVVPGSDFSTGFGVKANLANDETPNTYDLGTISKAQITTSRSAVTNLGNLDEMIHADWFIAPGGTGKGTSWEDAGGLPLFLSLISYKTNDSGVNSTWRLKNAKIHFKEGEYNIEAANGNVSLTFQAGSWDTSADDKYKVKNVTLIDGGYPSSNSGKSLSGQSTSTYPTKFICNQSANNDRIFYFNGCSIYDLTFQGITFTANEAASNNSCRGVAFFFNAATSGKVTFRDCVFSGLVSSSANGGGAIDFNSTGQLNVEFNNCSFLNNIANNTGDSYGGGAIVVEQGSDTVIDFKGCVADGNQSTSANGHGGFIYQKGGTITISDNTKIQNNSAVKRGGAIWSMSELSISGSELKSNSAANGGAIHIVAGAQLSVSGGQFTTNSATNGGAIRTEGACSLTVSDECSFVGNSAANGQGGAVHVLAGCEATIENATFSNNAAGTGAGGSIYNLGSVLVKGCSFAGNTAKNGASLYTSGADGALSKTLVFNSVFDGNNPTTTNQTTSGGAIALYTNYSRALLVNSTIRGTTGVALITNSSPSFDVVSCTFNENTSDFNRGFNNGRFYNSIMASSNPPTNNSNVQQRTFSSIFGAYLYPSTGGTSTSSDFVEDGLGAACLGTYSNGVYPLNSSKEASYSAGMSYDDIKKLTFTDITLTDDQKALLAKDQKGNPRTGTIMGAYVLTE